ncbi:MAG: anthranilate synthase component II [bacterium]
MILVIDNYDSFTFNLVQYLGDLGAELEVHRNDRIDLTGVSRSKPNGIIISPGPGRPEQAGIIVPLIAEVASKVPILGVCLGHQAIGVAFGGQVVQAPRLMHGKTSAIHHQQAGLFKGLPNPFEATRYHSLIVNRQTLPADLRITAESEDEIIMGLQHRDYPVFGVQFHPESILTREGKKLLENFLNICGEN